MPVGVLTNVCTVFIGTFIGGLIKKVLPKHLVEELPKVFGICSVTIGLMSVIQVKTLPMVIMAIILGFVIGEGITIVSDLGGNLIVNIKGARIALDKSMASRIMV